MANPKLFALNKALAKSLDRYKPKLNYGERLEMFNNVYKVLSSQDDGYTFVEDEKNSKLAYPTNKLRLMMKAGVCKNLGTLNMAKAQISGPSAKVGVTHAATNAAYAKQGAGASAKPRGQPVGTVKTGQDGQQYKKTQMSPAVWVRVSEGTTHAEPGGEEQNPRQSPKLQAKFDKLMTGVESKVHPQDRQKIHSMAEDWLKEKSKFYHMQAAHNAGEVDDKGQRLPRTGIPSSTSSKIFAQGDKARDMFHKLIEAVKTSHKKLRGESDAK